MDDSADKQTSCKETITPHFPLQSVDVEITPCDVPNCPAKTYSGRAFFCNC